MGSTRPGHSSGSWASLTPVAADLTFPVIAGPPPPRNRPGPPAQTAVPVLLLKSLSPLKGVEKQQEKRLRIGEDPAPSAQRPPPRQSPQPISPKPPAAATWVEQFPLPERGSSSYSTATATRHPPATPPPSLSQPIHGAAAARWPIGSQDWSPWHCVILRILG
jgi:hypothetical protein